MRLSAIRNDITAVENVVRNVDELFQNPWEGEELVSLSTGIAAPQKLVDDLLNAREKGMSSCMTWYVI